MKVLGKTKSILYVEDQQNIREELAYVIENFCDQLYLGDDGVQGVELYKKHTPDIVVSDIKMPFMDGIEMSKKIKEFDPHARIIFTTAFGDTEYFQEAIDLQVEGYILKPIDLDLLESKILQVISQIHLEEELIEKEAMLVQQSRLASMGEMITNVAHQWKQPLTAVSMEINNIIASSELDNFTQEQALKCAAHVSNQIKYLDQTINDFRSFFIPGTELSRYNASQFINKCINLVSAAFDDNTIETIKDIDEKIDTYGNPNQLIQALINILNNAKDALKMAEGIQKKLVFILTAKEDDKNNIIITIKDNAGGIPSNIIDHVFEPYFTTKKEQNGTGLGLYISKTIIEKNLKGTLSVENDEFTHEGVEYKGAKFTLTLPMQAKE
jgi:signal transduction histidine kinase